ncbi:peptidoglycan recognition protein-like [Lycorma delicatula]|uniref:peptidoglycan recognition protein-like n=1 Tax=Lycorma delicatula TaxID=130591 RepID=UPI003F515436
MTDQWKLPLPDFKLSGFSDFSTKIFKFGDNYEGKVKLNEILHFVQRNEWDAHLLDGDLTPMTFPIPYVIIHNTGTSSCFSTATCNSLVLSIQEYYIGKINGDIGFNFLIAGNGYIYVGRSWEYVGAHTPMFNRCSLGIGLIGSFTNETKPSTELMTALDYLLQIGVQEGKISKDYKLYAASTIKSTSSPGESVNDIIKNWSHWSTDSIIKKLSKLLY